LTTTRNVNPDLMLILNSF